MPLPAASRWPAPPEGLDPDRLIWAETVHPEGYTHLVVAGGTTLRLTDLEGDACAHLLAYNADEPAERLDVAETVRGRPHPSLTAGSRLRSARGRALATITQDSSGQHDPLFGTATIAPHGVRGDTDGTRIEFPPGRELLARAAARHHLGRRDIAPGISFFQGVAVDDDGSPLFLGSAGPRASVTIRAELALVLLIANTTHPLDPRVGFSSGRLEVLAWREATS